MAASPKPSGLVNVKIFASGSELPGDFQIHSIDITKDVNKIASAVIYFLDGNPNLQKFEISDKSELDPGNEIEIKAGYDTDADSVFKGMIVKHGVKSRGNGTFTVIECKDKAVLMTIENRCEIYEKKKDSDIIKTLIQRHGLTADVDATTYEHPQIVQYDCNDWDFTLARAELNGKIVTTIDNKVLVKEPKVESPVLTLEFGTNLIDFEADINANTQLSKVKATSWNVKSQEIAEKEVSSASFTETGSLKSSDLANKVKTDGHKVYHSGAIDQNELKDWSTSLMLRSKMSKLSGKIKCNGYAKINPGQTIELKGIGKKFNGNILVTSVRQQIESGYWFTYCTFGLNNELHAEKFNISALEASGLIPAVHGLQIGIVKKIHEDPDNQFRVQVSLPVMGSKTNVWARKIFPDAGKERGVYFFPEINDEVIVGFLNEDARFPVILGSLHSSKNKTPYVTDQKNIEKGIVTKEKLKLTFNDEDKSVTIETPAKQKIVIDDKTESILLQDKQGNTVTLKKNLIELKGKGDISIEATKNVSIKANKITIDSQTDVAVSGINIKNEAKAQFKAAGNAKSELSSGGQVEVKGGAMVQVQGALVKIN